MNLSLLTRRSPINGNLTRLHNEMDRTFSRLFIDPWTLVEPSNFPVPNWFPPVDLSESDDEILVRTEIPGLKPEDLDINVVGTVLTISGHKEQREETKGEDFYQSECRFGSFRRVIDLPDAIDADNVTADYEDGVVTLSTSMSSEPC